MNAIQCTGTPESNRAIIDMTRGSKTPATMDKRVFDAVDGEMDSPQLSLAQLTGSVWVSPGEWVVQIADNAFCVNHVLN